MDSSSRAARMLKAALTAKVIRNVVTTSEMAPGGNRWCILLNENMSSLIANTEVTFVDAEVEGMVNDLHCDPMIVQEDSNCTQNELVDDPDLDPIKDGFFQPDSE
ncbi:hypothetical protein PR048_018731 [Dryococelus australis]|uniref:Uncharacterized protein n=1 Tax=Dryococelus australis TaxID=614101 RepID=A0ABQ9HD50_9NEOP|nr:hypothetical protein PR048_018731 [Dryococelus australis]